MHARPVFEVFEGWLVLFVWEEDGGVGEGGVFAVEVACVDAEAVNAAVEPVFDGFFVDCSADLFELPI